MDRVKLLYFPRFLTKLIYGDAYNAAAPGGAIPTTAAFSLVAMSTGTIILAVAAT